MSPERTIDLAPDPTSRGDWIELMDAYALLNQSLAQQAADMARAGREDKWEISRWRQRESDVCSAIAAHLRAYAVEEPT